MRLTKDEIARARDASPMELFAQGIRSRETLEKYSRTPRQVTCGFLEGILEGEFGERVASWSGTRGRSRSGRATSC
jgi:hypothetical protein